MTTPNVTSRPTGQALLSELQAAFAASDQSSSGASKRATFGPSDLFFMRDGMWIILEAEDIPRYHGLVDAFFREIPRTQRSLLSRRTIEAIAQSAVVAVAKGPKDEPTLKEALRVARKHLLAAPETWEIWCAVVDMKLPTRRRSFGRVTFQKATSRTLGTLRSRGKAILSKTTNTPSQKATLKAGFAQEITDALDGRVIASVSVTAVDKETAERLAIEEMRETLDIIGFFGSLLEPVAVLPSIDRGGEWPGTPVLSIRTDRSASWPLASDRRGPSLNLDRLFERKPAKDLLISEVSKLLRKHEPSESERRILTAMRWAGRAAGRPRPSEQFLYYLIALESLLLPATADSELTYRFKLRAAHVLVPKVEHRHEISKRIGQLYDIRSTIVHTGSQDVAAEDLSAARHYTLLAILRMLKRLKKHPDIENWFVQRAFE